MTPDHPESWRCLRIALHHIFGADATGANAKVFPGATWPELIWCMAQPGVRHAEAQAHAVAATGDVAATKAASQAWARACKLAHQTWQAQHAPEAA